VSEISPPGVLAVEPGEYLLVRAGGLTAVDRQQFADRAAPLQLLGRLGERAVVHQQHR
jgi:hypothetical protein